MHRSISLSLVTFRATTGRVRQAHRRRHSALWRASYLPVAFLAGMTLVLTGCSPFRPAEVLYKRDALYNFLEEGFLADDLLQTAGTSTYRSEDGNLGEIRGRCLERARDMALDRMVSIMLHTRFNIRGQLSSGQVGDFARDYPRRFSDRDTIRGSADFADLLGQHFVAYEDLSSAERCLVTIRVIRPSIARVIRSHPVSFQLAP